MKRLHSGGRTCRPPYHPLRKALLFTGLAHPVDFSGCPLLFRQAQLFFQGWPFAESLEKDSSIIHVRAVAHQGRGYVIRAPWLRTPLYEPTAASALCSLAIELAAAFCEEHPRMLCLHAAAVRHGKVSLLILGNNYAGKSTLVGRLMAAGWTSLGDDLIGVTAEGNIMSFGIPPRLRLPVPSSRELLRFVHSSDVIRDERYLYLLSDSTLSAPFGTITSPTHIVVLQRRSRINAEVLSLKRQAGLIRLIPHYVMRTGSAEAVFLQAAKLIRTTPAVLFRYDDLDEAAVCLGQLSESDAYHPLELTPSGSDEKKIPTPESPPVLQQEENITADTLEQYIRLPGVRTFHEYGRTFLVAPEADTVYGLNRMGEIIWSLLTDPLGETEAIQLLHESFPSIDKERIRRDIASLFNILKEKRLISRI